MPMVLWMIAIRRKYATQQKADAQLYQRQKEAEAKQFEIQKQAEAKKAQAEADRFATDDFYFFGFLFRFSVLLS